ncbi:MAG: N,N-dimethylformamidase beta subunit family domain-containing protein [Betaproteobacteria bacterium]
MDRARCPDAGSAGLFHRRARRVSRGAAGVSGAVAGEGPRRGSLRRSRATVLTCRAGIGGLGSSGLAYGGAAGIELDRYDLSLGTPPHTRILASSGGHSDNYLLSIEEVLYPYPGLSWSQDYRIRGDMTYFSAPNNGAVFCGGSIAFGQALPANGFENNVSIVLGNVVDAFIKPGRLPRGLWVNQEKQWR